MKINRKQSQNPTHKPGKAGYLKSKKLIAILKKYRMLKDAKLLEAFTLNYAIFKNVSVLINEKEKVLTLEYQLPIEFENEIVTAITGSGIKEMTNKMPYDFIEGLLYRLARPVYHYIAQEKGWLLSWVHQSTQSRLGDLQEKNTVIRVSLHPLSLKEKKESIYNSIINQYITVKTSKMKNETKIERSTDKIPLSGNRLPGTVKVDDKIIAQFIEQLQAEKVIDAECNTAYSDKQFEKYIRKMVDPEDKATKECEHCGKPFVRISRKRKYCPGDSCKTLACRAKKAAKSA
jgi:hypothetical protein